MALAGVISGGLLVILLVLLYLRVAADAELAERVLRAMERAGNRMKNGLPQTTKVAACDLYRHVKVSHNQIDFLLEDAWSMLDHFVPAHELERYQAGLTTYAHRLLRTQEPISRQEMLECLKKTS